MPDFTRYVREKLGPLPLAPGREAEIVEEIAEHIRVGYEGARRRGMTEEEALELAEQPFVPWEALRTQIAESECTLGTEAARLERGIDDYLIAKRKGAGGRLAGLVADLWQDLRFAVRSFRRRPGFTSVAVVTIALGIGVTTLMFSVVNGVLLQPLPYPDSDRLVRVYQTNPEWLESDNPSLRSWWDSFPVSYPVFQDWNELDTPFENLGVYADIQYTITGGNQPELIDGLQISSGVFSALGVNPLHGRFLLPPDDEFGAPALVVLSHSLWQGRYGGDPAIVGQTVVMSETPHLIVGIMPRDFSFGGDIDLWTTLTDEQKQWPRGSQFLAAIARLTDGTSLGRAQQEMEVISARITELYPDEHGFGVRLVSYKDLIVGSARPALIMILCAVGLLLLIAGANTANLLLVRTVERRRELTVRMVLGAGRRRLAAHLIGESVLLSAAGGAVGCLFAFTGLKPFLALLPASLPRATEILVDHRVLIFSVVLSLLIGLGTGIIPSLGTGRFRFSRILHGGGRHQTGDRRHHRLQSILTVSEITLTFVMLSTAGMLMQSLHNLTTVNPGFSAEHRLIMQMDLPETRYDSTDRILAFQNRLAEQLAAIPGIVDVAGTGRMPYADGTWAGSVTIDAGGRLEESNVDRSIVTSSFFSVMGIPVTVGRTFTSEDLDAHAQVVVVNEALARRYWPGQEAIGKRLKTGRIDNDYPWLTVIGVVGDVAYQGLDTEPRPTMYWHYRQRAVEDQTVVLRVNGATTGIFEAAQGAVWEIDPDLPISRISWLEDLLSTSIAPERFRSLLLSTLAGLAVLIAAVGLFGVLAYTVAQSTRDIGIRMALGAGTREVMSLVFGRTGAMIGSGLAIGLVIYLIIARVLESFLFKISPTDPPTLIAVALVLTGVALAAVFVPARRAARIDPVEVMRGE